ncbi:hypothetical protein A0W34_31730 (plasmid) [Rhodococcus sp. BH4]|nr:hypothetical protein A0W34_31730 [Rhodococcus sp. BH4]
MAAQDLGGRAEVAGSLGEESGDVLVMGDNVFAGVRVRGDVEVCSSSRASLIPARESSRAASMVRSLRSTDSLSRRSSASSARSTKSASGVKVNAAAVMVSSFRW